MTRAELAEQIARRIAAAGGTDPKQPEDGTWRLWLDVAESIADLVADAWEEGRYAGKRLSPQADGIRIANPQQPPNPYRRADA